MNNDHITSKQRINPSIDDAKMTGKEILQIILGIVLLVIVLCLEQ